MNSTRRSQEDRRTETRNQVLESARYLFGEKGYAATSLEDIASHGNLTIRPIYHYFGNKKNLFQAVAESLEQELADTFSQVMQHAPSINVGWRTFLQFSQDPHFRQIVLVDAPSILGRERWANNPVIMEARRSLQMLHPGLNPQSLELLSRMVIAALSEAALMSAEGLDDAVMDDLGHWLEKFLQGTALAS